MAVEPAGAAGAGGGATIRPATAADAAGILALIHELAEYEREPTAVEASVDDIAAALSGRDPVASALVAVRGGAFGPGSADPDTGDIVGMALWFRTFSTWTGRPGMWLEDLYVRPDHRRGGLGRRLIAELARICVDRGWPRLEWTVLDWNTPAHGFYRTLGAVPSDEWTTNRVSGAALTALAARAAAGPAEPAP